MTGAPIDLPEWLERLGFADDEYVQAGEKLPGQAFRGAVGPVGAIKAQPLQDRDYWVGPNPVISIEQMRENRKDAGRAVDEDVTRLAALHIDLDVKPGGCSSFDQARAIVDELAGMLGSRPVALTYSGHGLQPVWAIEDAPIVEHGAENDQDWIPRSEARALMRRWGRLVASVADRHGAHVDALWDLTRILRCPGSVNHKDPANPVPVLTFGDTGAPITVERILETLDEWGVVELPEDTKGAGVVVAPPSEWTYADQTCGYAHTMVQQWMTDQPTERHGWLLQNAPRIAAAVRYGCFDRAGHELAVATLTERFLTLLGNTRKPTPGEVAGALSWGQEAAACMTDNHLASELGYHLHAEPIPAPPDRKANDGTDVHTETAVPLGVPGLAELADGGSDGPASPGGAAELATGPSGSANPVEPSAWDLHVEQERRKLQARDEARELEDRRKAGGIAVPLPIRLDAFLSVPDEPVTYRIHGLMPTEARVMLAAQFKAGKTTTVGNLVRSLVDGDRFLTHFEVERPDGAVVVIDDEMSEQQLRRWLRDQGIVRTEAVSVVSLRGRVGSFDILNDAVRARWAAALSTVGCGLLVFDCLRPVLDALGLSEDKEAGRFLVAFDALLAEAKIAEAVVVHHMGHGGERSRGDSRIRDWPDVEWRLIRDVKQGEEDPAAARFFSAFGRDVSVPEGLVEMEESNRHLTFDPATSRKDHRKAQSEAGEPDPHQLIMRFLLDNPGAFAGEIDAHLNMRGVGLGRARRARQDMSGRGGPIRLEPIPGGKAVKHFYEATADGDQSTAVDSPCDVNPRTNPRPIHGRGMTSHGSPYRGPVDDPSLTGFESSYDSDPFGTGLSA